MEICEIFLQFKEVGVIGYVFISLVLPVIAFIAGAWLTRLVLPHRLKLRAWRWKKEVWAREFLFESLSRVAFLVEHTEKSECQDRFSMSGMGVFDVDNEIKSIIQQLHTEGHKLKLYLDKHNAKVFTVYLQDSQIEYDHAKETWGQWYDDDHIAVEQHTMKSISEQGEVAFIALSKFRI